MNKKILHVIETERLILRPFREEDAADVFEYLHIPAVHCFACMRLETLEAARAEMQRRVHEAEYYLAITLKESGKVIGEIEAYPETEAPHADENEKGDTFSPCWILNDKYQGKGYAYEAAHAFFDHLFSEKGARRIYAYTEDDNKPSQHLCEKLGMRREGLFKEFVSFIDQPDGSPLYENTIQYAILKREWLAFMPSSELQELSAADQEQCERIQAMEGTFDSVKEKLSTLEEALTDLMSRRSEMQKLIDYYESPLWRKDYQDDEAGLLPRHLKRGVLSQDGIYDLLTDLASVREQVKALFPESQEI